ncbi:DUF2591 family protein [Escherichia coli]
MDYSKLSDFEINRMVGDVIFKGLWACKPETSGNNTNKWYYGNADTTFGELKPLPNYCSKWDATGPIIEANGIGLRKQSNGLWCATRIGGEYPKYDNNPLRAAMIVFLMMQEANHA